MYAILEDTIRSHTDFPGLRVMAALMFILVAAAIFAPSVHADPEAVAKAKAEAQKLREQVQQLDDGLESAREDLLYAQQQLAAVEADIAANQESLAKSEADLALAYQRLGDRVVSIYQNGRVGLLDALFGAESLRQFVNRIHLLSLIGVQDSDVLEQVEAYRDDVAARKVELAAQREQQETLVAQAEAAGEQIENRLAERKRMLAGKEQELEELEREEEERQRVLAEEAAAEARRVAAQRAQQQAAASASRPATVVPTRNVPRSQLGAAVVEIALQYVGVPYVWGGESPSGFDCSGLVVYSFRQLGVSLPHSSRALFQEGVAIARADLQPGDLVFFGSPIHHVGIYVGGGNMVHAPYSGARVRVNSISRSNYAGARRIM